MMGISHFMANGENLILKVFLTFSNKKLAAKVALSL